MFTLKRAIGGAAAVAMLALSTGCEKKNKTASAPNVELTTVARENPAPAPASVPAKPASRLAIQGPRSEAELSRIYSVPVVVVQPVTPTKRISPVVATPIDDERVTADPDWNVNIAREWHHIVVHHSASPSGSAASFDKAHRARGWDGLGYHFVIGNGNGAGDGEVEVGFRWRQQTQGAHAGNAEYNQHGIGICLVGDFESGGGPSARQLSSLRRLVRFLQVKTGIPTSEVVGHENVPGKTTACPGKNMDLHGFRISLGGGAIGVPIHIAKDSKPARIARTGNGSAALP
jgi:hypothetical protein